MASNVSSPPVIGITTYLEQSKFGVWDTEAVVLPRGYVDGVANGGGMPVLLPPVGHVTADLLSRVDGLIVAGGADIDPVHYGAAPAPETGPPRPDRDHSEHLLIEAALANGVPLLAVCRGMQLLNVVLGGTLHQHVPAVVGGTMHQPAVGKFGELTVKVLPDSRLSSVVGSHVDVQCYHHQAVDALGAGVVPVAWADDGVVEAIELTDPDFVLGVQWHPEVNGSDGRLFEALVNAARESG